MHLIFPTFLFFHLLLITLVVYYLKYKITCEYFANYVQLLILECVFWFTCYFCSIFINENQSSFVDVDGYKVSR